MLIMSRRGHDFALLPVVFILQGRVRLMSTTTSNAIVSSSLIVYSMKAASCADD